MKSSYAKILFDFDGTLVDSRLASIKATQQVFVEFDLTMPTEKSILHHMGIPIERSFPIMGGISYPMDRHTEVLSRFRELYGPICDAETAVYADIPELLYDLKTAGVQLAVVTSKKSTVTLRTLACVGLVELFPIVVGSEHVANYKPHPQPALMAAELLGGGKGRVLVVGDAVSDVEMGKAAEFDTCAVTWGAHSAEQLAGAAPTYLVDTTSQLRRVILSEKLDVLRDS